jgi:quinol-cytochrome oxidoreductase complex cytochrome b subunit
VTNQWRIPKRKKSLLAYSIIPATSMWYITNPHIALAYKLILAGGGVAVLSYLIEQWLEFMDKGHIAEKVSAIFLGLIQVAALIAFGYWGTSALAFLHL